MTKDQLEAIEELVAMFGRGEMSLTTMWIRIDNLLETIELCKNLLDTMELSEPLEQS